MLDCIIPESPMLALFLGREALEVGTCKASKWDDTISGKGE